MTVRIGVGKLTLVQRQDFSTPAFAAESGRVRCVRRPRGRECELRCRVFYVNIISAFCECFVGVSFFITWKDHHWRLKCKSVFIYKVFCGNIPICQDIGQVVRK